MFTARALGRDGTVSTAGRMRVQEHGPGVVYELGCFVFWKTFQEYLGWRLFSKVVIAFELLHFQILDKQRLLRAHHDFALSRIRLAETINLFPIFFALSL